VRQRVDVFKARMGQFVREVRAQPRLPDVERIFVPGEIEQEQATKSVQAGVLVPAAGCQELDRLAARLNVRPLSERLGQSA
jgi:LDH2 family malate/lactate/ureidoglycolate dehydrogenase